MCTTTGRRAHSVRAALTDFRKQGLKIFRDKIAASKKMGMSMGGVIPLGYDVVDRNRDPNEAEA